MRYLLLLLIFITIDSLGSEPVPINDGSAELCLALNIFHESRGESVAGQLAVASVTMNRVKSKDWPNTVCAIVYQPAQFSWTLKRAIIPKHERKAFQRAKEMAGKVLRGGIDIVEGADYFHKINIKPCWLTDVDKVARIDNHIFYKSNGKRSGACL